MSTLMEVGRKKKYCANAAMTWCTSPWMALHRKKAPTDSATRRRLLNQAASKLRVAACGVFPDADVALELVKVRLEQVQLEPNDEVLRKTAEMAFEELRSFPSDDAVGSFAGRDDAPEGAEGKAVEEDETDMVQCAVRLADALMMNSFLMP
mgnify:CR=1 FL=1